MDQWKSEGLYQTIQTELAASDFDQFYDRSFPSNRLKISHSESRERAEFEVKDSCAARKVKRAEREKLGRDHLNEQFLELGNALDSDRSKNDKVTILTDAIQTLKDLTSQVNSLKAENASLSEESRELTQEKNELREEKTALKSEINNINDLYQQRLRVLFTWASMGPPYQFPTPVAVPPSPIPIYPSLQPFPFFRNENLGAMPNPCSTFLPSHSPSNPQNEQPSKQHVCPHPRPCRRSQTASKQVFRRKSSDHPCDRIEKRDGFNDVATELALKTPGSTVHIFHLESATEQGSSYEGRNGNQQRPSHRKQNGGTDGSCLSRCSSSCSLQDNSSNSVGDGS